MNSKRAASPRMARRGFLQKGAAAAAALPLLGRGRRQEQVRTVRLGVVGVGGRGTGLLSNALSYPGIEVPALCDVAAAAAERGAGRVTGAGQPAPDRYTRGPRDFLRMFQRDDLDAVLIATPWKWHVPMATAAMEAGITTGVEVPAALSLEECWQLVETCERTGTPCMMLENWSFRRDNLAVLQMVRQGLLGRIVHCHCAHSHDCIDHWFFDARTGADKWPAKYLLEYNRDQYPTHSLGPVLSWLDVNCGDRFTSVTATATDSFGIQAYFERRFGVDHPGATRSYAQGDIVTSVLRTARGKTVVVNYDLQLPRPYDNRWMLQGTLGIYNEQREAVYLTGRSPQYHQWEPFAPYQDEHEHPWWRDGGHGGHGGVDGVMLGRFLEAVRAREPLPIDVYDSVTMSALVALSGESIARDGAPVEFPDFTRGRWESTPPKFAVAT